MKLSVDSKIAWGDNKAQMITNVVSCEYEDVCKMWAEREDVHRTCKGCKYDEVNCTNPEPCVTNEFGSRTGYTRKETTAEWFVMSSQDLDRFETKITAECSVCGYVHNIASIDEKTQILAHKHNSLLGVIDLHELDTILPAICPGCLSKMIVNR